MFDYKNNLIKDMMQTLSEHSANGVYIADKDGIIYANNGFATMFGYSREDILSHNITLRELIIPEHYHMVMNVAESILNNKTTGGNFKITGMNKSGELIYLDCVITSDDHQGKRIIVSSIIDKTEEVKLGQQLKQMKKNYSALEDAAYMAAYFDHTTGLPNRRMFVEELEEELAQSDPAANDHIAMVLINVQKFKLINNSLGHQIGEVLIKQLAQQIDNSLSEGQTLYRIAGDKFCVVFVGATQRRLLNLANHIFELSEQEFIIEGYKLNITINIGVSMSPLDGNTVDHLFRAAETALYFSKTAAVDKVKQYSQSLSVQAFKTFSLNNDLPKALERNQFFIQYMPRVNTNSTRIVGTEALIRWRHPDWGIVPPAEFIPLAEESGLIEQIGEWVLREACKQNKQWLDKGKSPIKIAVNISARQLVQQNLIDIIDSILMETGMPSRLLEVELTESVLVDNPEHVAELIEQLDQRQISVSLDDFGTGYSTLYSLKHLKVDTLKIDRSFTSELFSDSVNKSIVQNIVSLASDLEMKTIAEGVETLEQYHFMKNIRCNEIQGYYFSRPLDPDQIDSLLELPFLPHDSEKKVQYQFDKDNRKHMRIEFTYPLVAEMTMTMFKMKKIDLGKSEVFVKNICAGGLNFETGMKLPVSDDIIFEFTVHIMGQTYDFKGVIIWCNEVDSGEVYEYGVNFV